MADIILSLFEQHQQLAFFLSIVINILISTLAVVPSVFLTAANILFFGFWEGTLISFVGESFGAMFSFWLYRISGRALVNRKLNNYPRVQNVLFVEGKEAFLLILSLRLLPFIPSGLITLTAALGKVSFFIFFLSTVIGKIPALLIEAYSVYEVTRWTNEGKIILFLAGSFTLLSSILKIRQSRSAKKEQ
ncbi:TVP38/TMEM64 family protein [Bacillus litorisediminis]|uniref:TVP38/TMEM64 family protein n=1 Tax=Bacillus litorisediminis TaxID=2922713 RepID=UPI001FAF64DF|nr:VTT domain-containing protein [Bacillus litorisediminis]